MIYTQRHGRCRHWGNVGGVAAGERRMREQRYDVCGFLHLLEAGEDCRLKWSVSALRVQGTRYLVLGYF